MRTTPGSSRIFWCGSARTVAVAATILCGAFIAGPATAEVHFGNNVFIGGHNFSHQTYNRRHRLHVTLYDRPIRGGCVTRGDGRGGTVRRCRLQRVPH